jgi:hypothetical protein
MQVFEGGLAFTGGEYVFTQRVLALTIGSLPWMNDQGVRSRSLGAPSLARVLQHLAVSTDDEANGDTPLQIRFVAQAVLVAGGRPTLP